MAWFGLMGENGGWGGGHKLGDSDVGFNQPLPCFVCYPQVLTDVMLTGKNLHARDMAPIPGFAAEEMIIVIVIIIVVIILVLIVVLWTFLIRGIVIKEVLGGVIGVFVVTVSIIKQINIIQEIIIIVLTLCPM